MFKRRHANGKFVYAKWPGSKLYYKAEIFGFDEINNLYSVKFDEGDIFIVSPSCIISENVVKKRQKEHRSRSRSPSRSRKSGRKSRASSVSPIRNQSSTSLRGRSTNRQIMNSVDKIDTMQVHDKINGDIKVMKEDSQRPVEAKAYSWELKEESRCEDTKVPESTQTIKMSEPEKYILTQRLKSAPCIKTESKETKEVNEKIDPPKSKLLPMFYASILLISSITTLFLPLIIVYGLYLCCDGVNDCSLIVFPTLPYVSNLFEIKSFVYVLLWVLFQAALAVLPFGKVVSGPPLADQKKWTYKLNGIHGFIFSLLVFGVLVYCGQFPLDVINTYSLSLVTATFLFTLIISFIVLVISRYSDESQSSEGMLQDFVFGCIRNPRLFGGKLDIKTYAFKTGFISWGVLNLTYLVNLWNKVSEPNVALILLVAFQLWYIMDHMIFEETNLYTASLSSEKIGFVGLNGMFLFFPFFCSLQARYLSLHPHVMPWSHYVAPFMLQVIGYIIYRSSVLEKFQFRKNPHKAKLSGALYISTLRGKDILVGGWWGRLRHPNYLGDLLMNYSWALLCGFSHFFPWIWAIGLTFLLIAMAWRDDKSCLEKYGKYWEEYRDEVKYKMIPFVF